MNLEITSNQVNENQNHNETFSHTCYSIHHQKDKTKTNVGKDMEKGNPYIIGGIINDASIMENSMMVSQKIKDLTIVMSRRSLS